MEDESCNIPINASFLYFSATAAGTSIFFLQ